MEARTAELIREELTRLERRKSTKKKSKT